MNHIKSESKKPLTRDLFHLIEGDYKKTGRVTHPSGKVKTIIFEINGTTPNMVASDMCDLTYKYGSTYKAYKREEGDSLHVLFFWNSRSDLEKAISEYIG